MAIAPVQNASNSATTGTTVAVTIAAPQVGSCLVCHVLSDGAHVSSISGGGVTWVLARSSATHVVNETWYGLNSTGSGTTVTITYASTVTSAVARVMEFSGVMSVSSSALDQSPAATNGTVSPVTSPNAVTVQQDEVLIAAAAGNGSPAVLSSGPTNSFNNFPELTINTLVLSTAYRIVNATGTYSTSWSFTGATGWDSNIISLRGVAVAWRAAGTFTAGTTTVASLPQPTGTATGDILVAFIVDHATSGTSAAPTGWTRQAGVAGTAGRFQVFTAVVGQGGLTGTSWTFSGLTSRAGGIIHGFSDGDPTTPVSGTPTAQLNASGTTGTTTLTPAANNAMIVAGFAALASGSTWSAEACATTPVITERSDNANSTFLSIAVATGAEVTAAATGATSSTMGTAGANAGILIALNNLKITGTIAATPQHSTASLSGKLNETATAATTLPKVAASGTGTSAGAGSTGTAAATLKHVTASLSGADINIDGPIVATLKHLTASASGKLNETGTAAATLPRLAVSASGSLKETGTAAATLKHLTVSASGSDISIDGTIAATLKHPTASATGKLNESGTAAATLRKLSASATATQNETGTAAATLKHSTASLSGSSVQFTGPIAAGLRSLSAAATGKLNETGTASPVLPHVTVSAVGKLSESGTIAVALRHSTVSAAGTYAIKGVGTVGLRSLSASATGKLNETAVEAATLPRVSVAATGKLNETGTAAATLKHVTVVGSSQSIFTGSEHAAIKPLAASGSGELNEAGAVAATLPKLSASVTGTATNPPTTGVGASNLKHATVAGAGVLSETGTTALSLRHSVVNATGVIFAPPILGSGAITLPFLIISGRSTEVSIDVSITLAHDVSISAVTFHDSNTTVKVN